MIFNIWGHKMSKINLYVFSQIIKSCTLVFFIFVSIAWLMQLSRLLSAMNNLQIEFLAIFSLSLWLIPNLINVTLPFIIIFGLVFAFAKLDKDKEIIAIYSLGLSTNELKKPIINLLSLTSIAYLFLNFLISPFTYNIYKEKEFLIRNSVDLNKLNISNFIELDNDLIIDFKKEDNNFTDIFISYFDENENLIFANKGHIENKDNNLIFNLINGYKIVFKKNELEKLQFDNYKLKFPTKNNSIYSKNDANTLTLFDLINDKNIKNNKILFLKFADVLIIISFIFYFYFYFILKNNFSLKNFFIFIIFGIITITLDNFLENFSMEFFFLIIIGLINILFIQFIGLSFNSLKLYEK